MNEVLEPKTEARSSTEIEAELDKEKRILTRMRLINSVISFAGAPKHILVARFGFSMDEAETLIKQDGYSTDEIEASLKQIARLTIQLSDARSREC